MRDTYEYDFYVTYKNGDSGTFRAYSAAQRDLYIKDVKNNDDIVSAKWCRRYVNGEQGAFIEII